MKKVSGNVLLLKEANTNIIRKALKQQQLATAQQLAEATGLTSVTVNTILQQLVRDGEVFEAEKIPSRGGRPAQSYRFNNNFAHAAVIFAHESGSDDTVFYRAADLTGNPVFSEQKALPQIQRADFEPLIERMITQIPTVKAIGFGLPGVEYGGYLRSDYSALNGSGFLDHFRTKYGLPVIFENDVNAACLGYCARKQLDRAATLLYLYFPQKYIPGAAIFIDGKIHKGFRNHAGEIRENTFNIPWTDREFQQNEARFCKEIAGFITGICAILSPEKVVLSGSLIHAENTTRIREICEGRFDPQVVPEISLTDSFNKDYETGIIAAALEVLEPKLFLQK